jgi:hypothetical protein
VIEDLPTRLLAAIEAKEAKARAAAEDGTAKWHAELRSLGASVRRDDDEGSPVEFDERFGLGRRHGALALLRLLAEGYGIREDS